MDGRVSFRRLEIFCLVVERDSVTRAAEELFVAQPAVSSQLRALESWIGAKLFARSGNKLELTEAGRRTYGWAQEVLARTLEVKRDLDGIGDGTNGVAVISSSMAVGTYLLSPLLTQMRTERSGAELTLHIVQPQEGLRAVEVGQSDMAVVSWHEARPPAHLVEERLAAAPIVLCTAADGPRPDSLAPEQVPQLPHVAAPAHLSFQQNLDRQLHDAGISDVEVMIRLGHATSMKRAVLEHGWVVWLPRYSIEAELRSGELKLIDVPGVQISEPIALYYREEKTFSALQVAIVEEMRSRIVPLSSAPAAAS